jgi:hypothetical protein
MCCARAGMHEAVTLPQKTSDISGKVRVLDSRLGFALNKYQSFVG